MLSIHKPIQERLDSFIQNNKIPNIIFHGENGCGKKTILKNFLDTIYKDVSNPKDYIMNVNCAFGKGIRFIREQLKFFAKTNAYANNNCIKSIVLLDCELLTTEAQSALRRCIELFSNSTRFFIVVNDKERLLKPIVSRFCSIFVPLPLINGIVTNLHVYNKQCYGKHNKSKQLLIHKTFRAIDEYNDCDCDNQSNSVKYNVFSKALELYEKGVSYYDIEEFLKNKIEDSREKYLILVSICNYKHSIKNDKILISQVLNLYKMRKHMNLENICSM